MLEFDIYYKGVKVGETTAISASKAASNYWWNNDKLGDKFHYTDRKPSDYTVRLKEDRRRNEQTGDREDVCGQEGIRGSDSRGHAETVRQLRWC